jgi:hypothetical protein
VIAELILGALALGTQTEMDTGANAPPYLLKDQATLAGWLAGRWDNDREVFFAADDGRDPATIAPRQHVRITMDGDTGTLMRDGDSQTWSFELRADGPSLAIEQTLRRDNATCLIAWRRMGGHFAGTPEGEGCTELFDLGTQRPASLSVHEATLAVVGEEGIAAGFRRARPFTCWTAILRGAEHGDLGVGNADWDFRRGVTLHDQGGEATLVTDEPTPRTIRLRLRDVDWTYGDRRPSLTLYVLEGESDRAVSYAWTGGGEDRIGINLRWLQASCTADGVDRP